MQEKVHFKTSDGLTLCGILTKPENKTKKCIILCHGITVNKEEGGSFPPLAKLLSDEGFASLRFDFRAHGESEGNSLNLTVTGEKLDLEAVFRFLENLGFKEFGILAASFAGGATSLFAPNQKSLKAIVLWYPCLDYNFILKPKLPWPKKNFGKEAMQKLERDGFIIVSDRMKVSKKLINELKTIKPWEELMKTDLPILFVHSDGDTYVPYQDSVKYSKMLNAKLETIHGECHGFQDNKEYQEQADRATVNFFKKHL
jgi:dipeptidyl aminopeptidase/acylaminoacyl peptidase